MANIFSFLFGSKYPSTTKYEADLQQLAAEKKQFLEFENSPIYKKYTQLDEVVNSGDFEKKVEKLKHEKFEHTDAYHKLKKHDALKKSKDIKTFLEFVKSGKEKRLDAILISPQYIEMTEMEAIVHSSEFVQKSKQKEFKKTDDYRQLQSLKHLEKLADNKFAKKTLASAEYNTYEATKRSPRLQEFIELDNYINSNEFIELHEFMKDKHRFKKSDEYKLLHEYNEIKNSTDFKWFTKTKANYPFGDIDKWQLSFEDDFDHQKLDATKWMTGYYWGKALLNDNYVLRHEKQFFTDKNLETRDSRLKILTHHEVCNGKVWDPEKGFLPAKFNYTSGLINTGHAFRQRYGKFDIKLKLNGDTNVEHAIWFLGEKMVPQITVMKTSGKNHKSFEVGTVTGDIKKPQPKNQKLHGANLSSDFYILSMEWQPNSISWSINGVKIGEQTSNIPTEPMYLILSSHITNSKTDSNLQASMEIDWVKCYQPTK